MATTKTFFIQNVDGTNFCTSVNAGAEVRIMTSDQSGTVGSLYDDAGNAGVASGLWNGVFSDGDSGFYVVQRRTTAAPTWTNVDGLDPVYVTVDEPMLTEYPSLEDDLDANSQSMTDVANIYLSGTTSKIGTSALSAIEYQNLVDKTAAETVSGNWTISGNATFSGTNSVTGTLDFDPAALKINGTAISASVTAAQVSALKDVDTTNGGIMDTSRGLGSKATGVVGSVSLTSGYGGVIYASGLSANITLTLPTIALSNAGIQYLVTNKDATYSATLATTGSNTFQYFGASVGYSNLILTKGESALVMSDGEDSWLVLGSHRAVAFS